MASFPPLLVFILVSLVTAIVSGQRQQQDDPHETTEEIAGDPNDFCTEPFVDSAYFNGYDIILTRGDRLWYYYKDRHQLSRAYDQRRFTQGDHIQGAFNVSRTPYYCLNRRRRRRAGRTDGDEDGTGNGNNGGDCIELQKLRSMAIYFLHNKSRTRSYYNVDARHPNGTQKRVRSRDLPWNMKQVGLLAGGQLWPAGWEMYHKYRPVAFLPSRYELVFVVDPVASADDPRTPAFQQQQPPGWPVLVWNNLDATDWNSSWRSNVLHRDPPVRFTGMFEMNGVVYAIGERMQLDIGNGDRPRHVAKMFRYVVTEDDGRDLKETEQSVEDFFGCPPSPPQPVAAIDPLDRPESNHQPLAEDHPPDTNAIDDQSTAVEAAVSATEHQRHAPPPLLSQRQPTVGQPMSVFLRNSRARITSVPATPMTTGSKPVGGGPYHKLAVAGGGGVTLRETDSIMLTILIAIVIGASVLCIVLACLVINGKKRHLPSHFDGGGPGGHRIDHPVLGKPTIIGLDYHRRKNSTASSLTPFNFLSRYDSMNSLTAIYSQVHQHHPAPPLSMVDGGGGKSRPQPPPPVGTDLPSPSPSPNLHALYPRTATMQSSGHHRHPAQKLTNNKSVFVNLPRRPAPARPGDEPPTSLLSNNSSSVPNLAATDMHLTDTTGGGGGTATTTSGTDRIKSFERFENLI